MGVSKAWHYNLSSSTGKNRLHINNTILIFGCYFINKRFCIKNNAYYEKFEDY